VSWFSGCEAANYSAGFGLLPFGRAMKSRDASKRGALATPLKLSGIEI
jgi:hypothetical protein